MASFTELFEKLLQDGRLDRTIGNVHRRMGRALSRSDFSQEVLLRCWSKRDTFRGDKPEELLAWVRRVASSIVVDLIRYEAARRRYQTRSLVEADLKAMETDATSEGSSAAVRRAIDVRSILAKLGSQERTVLVYHYYEGLSFREIARLLKRPYDAVTRLHAKALRRIRDAGWLGIVLAAFFLS